MRHLRQLGLVNQPKLARLNVLVTGRADEVADTLVLLDQLGACQEGGSIGVHVVQEDKPTAMFWKLAYPTHDRVQELVNAQPELYREVSLEENTGVWDVHLSFSGVPVSSSITVFGSVHGPRAAVSTKQLPSLTTVEAVPSHPLTPSLRVVCASAMLERMLDELQLRNAVLISDAWVTITCRIETTDEEEARAKVASTGGMPISIQPTADGLATLARVRLPHPLPINPFEHLDVRSRSTENLPGFNDVGLLPWNAPPHALDVEFEVHPTTMVMLGVGGLGSWSAPLLMEKLPGGSFHVVDGDTSIELHNLNRQVLYNSEHVGFAKAEVAGRRLQSLNGGVSVHVHPEHLLPMHVEESLDDELEDEVVFESFDLDQGAPASKLPEAIRSSTLFFGCLDNMRARTLLNEAALHRAGTMINGGSESVHGIVERLSNEEGCMVCRYGRDVAREEEIISCTEEGARPVASIATTTAWAGAMMAAFGLIEASPLRGVELPRLQWHQGSVKRNVISSKPPWMNESCLRHI